MKKIKVVAILGILGIAVTSFGCKMDTHYEGGKRGFGGAGNKTEYNQGDVIKSGIFIDGKMLEKTTEIVIIPEGTTATVNMEVQITSYNGYGVFLKDRKVELSPFVMNAYQVTQELYEAVMGSNPSYCTADRTNYKTMLEGEIQNFRPVENVNWYDSIVFCNKLSKLCNLTPCYSIEGSTDPDDWGPVPNYSDDPNRTKWDAVECNFSAKGYRLPTEAEWEFAARGGDPEEQDWKYAYAGVQTDKYSSSFTNSPNDEKLSDYGWYRYNLSGVDNVTISVADAGYGTHEVGLKLPNRLGLYDMSGNVYEWCYDWWKDSVTSNDATYTQDGTVKNPLGASSGSYRVRRGGCWDCYAWYCSVSYRDYGRPYYRDDYIGFRLVRSL